MPPSVVTGSVPPGPMAPDSTIGPALARFAESVRLELADDLEGERVVELGHVHVARPEPGHGEGGLRPLPLPTQPAGRTPGRGVKSQTGATV